MTARRDILDSLPWECRPMLRPLAILATLFPASTFGQDKPESSRLDLVTAIRKKLALDSETDKVRAEELDDMWVSAKTGLYTFKSTKAKTEFIKQIEDEIKGRETIHEDAAKDLKKVIGFMGMPKMDAVGHLNDPKCSVTVEKVLDKKTSILRFRYRTVELVPSHNTVESVPTGIRVQSGPMVSKSVAKIERFALAEFDTTKMVRGKSVTIDQVLYIGDTYEPENRLMRAVPVVLTDAEKVLVRVR
jgi:hypothetical protein